MVGRVSMNRRQGNLNFYDILSQLDSMQNLSGENVAAQISNILGSNMDMTAYTAVNNLTRLIAEGEKKGISMYNMLMNPSSPDYLINDLIHHLLVLPRIV